MTEEDIQEAHRLHLSGLTLAKAGASLGFSAAAICKQFKARQLPTRPRGPRLGRGRLLTPEDEKFIVEVYQAHRRPLAGIARQLGCSSGAVRTVLRRHGVPTRREWSKQRRPDGVVCLDCGQLLTDENGHRDQARRTGWTSRCTDCCRHHMRLSKYGLDHAAVAALLERQRHACAICGVRIDDRTLRVDHCHATGVVRGLLCDPCNLGLGLLEDESTTLRRMADYLEQADTGLVASPQISYTVGDSLADHHRFYTYGLTPAQFRSLKDAQDGVCACCRRLRVTRRAPDLVVEHCHGTGRIRGLTCQFCNRAIAIFVEDAARIRQAATYLEAACPG